MSKKFKLITAGGTFDRLHAGHEFFLKKAFSLSPQVIIGITSDDFAKKKLLSSKILPFEKRKNDLLEFLRKNDLLQRTTLVKLDNLYGPTIDKDLAIEGILVTEKTLPGAQIINKKRQSLNLPSLKIIKVGMIKETQDLPISSLNSRTKLLLEKNLALPIKLRPLLQQPFGKLLLGTEDDLKIAVLAAKKLMAKNRPALIITVGDVVTRSFNQTRVPIDLALVDFKVKRKKIIKSLLELGFSQKTPDLIVKNPPGTISFSLSAGIKKMLTKINQKPLILKVLGEEDLAVLPAIILAPEDSAIFYGQPEKGIVFIKVDEDIKKRTLQLLSQFET